jgi:D-sedoheptulose 7-phosphate isomerase
MSAVGNRGTLGELLEQRLEQRYLAGSRFFASEAERIAQLCHQMAERFARGGRLVAFALTPAARSDARHVAVEFVHPVIVGKRALPALALCGESGPVAREIDAVTEPEDIVLAFGEPADGPALASALSVARARGCLTIAFASLPAEWRFEPRSEDPFVRQELVETTYHVLWELVHVFFEHRGLLKGRTERRVHDVGASSFLYPFLGEREDDLEAVLADVRRSVLMKAEEVHDLRVRTVTEAGGTLGSAAAALRACLDAGGRVFALGNGGSATDASDLVADLMNPPAASGWPRRSALDLTADTSIITAIANDIGPEAIFARQLIAYARAGDVLATLSTSGNSLSVLSALSEARRRGAVTIAFVGYDGGRVLAERLADHTVVSPSQHIPRIQEAHATAYHLLRELVEARAVSARQDEP